MTIWKNFELMAAGDISQATVTSNPVLVDQLDIGFAFACVTAGGGTGTLKVQACNDHGAYTGTDPATATGLTNWVDVTSATLTVTGDGVWMLNLSNQNYRWARVVYTRTAGSGTLNIRVNGKGDS